MKDFLGLLEYRRIFPPFLSISFAFYFIYLKDKFYLGYEPNREFSTTLFLTSIILTSFTLSFLWRFFSLETKIINWKFIRVYVDFALKHNPQSVIAKNGLQVRFEAFLEEFKDCENEIEQLKTKVETINELSNKINISDSEKEELENHKKELDRYNKNLSTEIISKIKELSDCDKSPLISPIFIIFSIKMDEIKNDNGNISANIATYKHFLIRQRLLWQKYALDYDKGAHIFNKPSEIKEYPDNFHQSYFLEVKISKINAGDNFVNTENKTKTCRNNILILADRHPKDENGKIVYKNLLEENLILLKESNVIKSYKRPRHYYYEWEFSVVTARWHDLDYLGNKYNKAEEWIEGKLNQKPKSFITLTIMLIIFIAIILYFLPKILSIIPLLIILIILLAIFILIRG